MPTTEPAEPARPAQPFRLHAAQADLDDLAERLARTRFTAELPSAGDEHGVPLAEVRRLVGYWRDGYDWRGWEARLNAYPQYTARIDGQLVHFLHVRSPEPDAFPLVLTHGWPMSVFEYLPVLDLLSRGDPPFHLVVPSIPGFGPSQPVREAGWHHYRIAAAWDELMRRLGYERYGAHGNDVGTLITLALGQVAADRVAGMHVTQVISSIVGDEAELGPDDKARLLRTRRFLRERGAYVRLQTTQPQTLAHALADSPAGLLAWHLQLLGDTSDDYVLTNVTLSWLTNTAGSAALTGYYEDEHGPLPGGRSPVPVGVATFPGDVFHSVCQFAERDHAIVSWHDHDSGGHHSAQQVPELVAADIRAFFRSLRACS